MHDLQTLHIELWNWLAENPTARKYDWPGFRSSTCVSFNKETLQEHSHCFACIAAYEAYGNNIYGACDCCPIEDWSTSHKKVVHKCTAFLSLFYMWDITKNIKLRKNLAIRIAEAWKEE